MSDRFSIRFGVRGYELDMNGHLTNANYHRYAEHARTEHLAAAGCSMQRVVDAGLGIVLLETHVRFLCELRQRDQVEVDSRIEFGEGKTFEIAQSIVRDDGVVAAEFSNRMGLLDARLRRLVAGPARRLRELATDPAVLGL